MRAPASECRPLMEALTQAEQAALRLRSAELEAATATLEASAGELAQASPATLSLLRVRLQRFTDTCHFLSRTLSDCLEAALAGAGSAHARGYARRGDVTSSRPPALVVRRYG